MEKWFPIQHVRKVGVQLDPPSHRVQLHDGRIFGIRSVHIRYRIEYNGPKDPTWNLMEVLLQSASGAVIYRDMLAEVPPWLLDIEARAEPMDP